MSGTRYAYSTTLSLFCLFFVGSVVLTSCGSQPNAQAGPTNKQATQSTVTPHPETTHPAIAIDWVNFIHFQGIMYMAVPEQKQKLSTAALDQIFDTVKFNVAKNIHTPGYKVKDGDAAFFDAGTRVYTVKGYRSTFRLAIPQNEKIILFEAYTNPQARSGADLLDIQGKVKAIVMRSTEDGETELGTIKDAAQIARLVNMVETAPVKQHTENNGEWACFIEFQLMDGSSTTHNFSTATGELLQGIMTPTAFSNTIKQVINKK